MWRVLHIRKNYYTTEYLMVWVKDMEALLNLMELLNIDACTARRMGEE